MCGRRLLVRRGWMVESHATTRGSCAGTHSQINVPQPDLQPRGVWLT